MVRNYKGNDTFLIISKQHKKRIFKNKKEKNKGNAYAFSVIIGTTCFLRETTPSRSARLFSNLTL